MVLPGPHVVSSPAAPAPPHVPVGDMGTAYGIQQFVNFLPGDVVPKQVIDTRRSEALWRVSVFGNVLLNLAYGTTKKREIFGLQAPLVITVPGQLTVTATPRDDAGTTCIVTLTYATAGAIANARKFVARAGVDVPLDAGAVRYFALTASTLTISGAAVVVPALQLVPLVAGSVLTGGSGFQEFEA